MIKRKDINKHYSQLFNKYGRNVKSVQWSDSITQEKRFYNLIKNIQDGSSIVDVGCGFGDLYQFIKNQEINIKKYIGIDFTREFINEAINAFNKEENASFIHADITCEGIPSGEDWYIASGIFNNKSDDNETFLFDVISIMYDACAIGITFNLLSTYVDYFNDDLFYIDPSNVFEFCKNKISPKVSIDHSYLLKPSVNPYEYTVSILK